VDNIISRKFSEKDKRELNDLYNLVASRSRTIKQFEWEWLKTPEGWGSMWLIVDKEKERIIGHHGLIPIRFSYFGRSILTGKTENTVMHPQYRGKGIYYPFEAKFLQESKERFQLNYTVSGVAEQGRVRLKLGYGIVGNYARYVKVYKISQMNEIVASFLKEKVEKKCIRFLLSGLTKIISPVLCIFFLRRGPIDKNIKLEKVEDIKSIADEWDRFWDHNKIHFRITVDRNSAYLKWRIFDNPSMKHTFFLARKRGEIVGYVITMRKKDKFGRIVDLVAKDNEEKIFSSIIKEVEYKFKKKGIFVVMFNTLFSNNSLNKFLRINGFISFSNIWKILIKFLNYNDSMFMVKALDTTLEKEKVLSRSNWYYTSRISGK